MSRTDEVIERLEVTIPADDVVLGATLSRPSGPPRPGVLLLGGTFSDTRDGDPDPRHRPDIPPHGMYRVLGDGLAAAGFAVLRFDRRGSGASTGHRPSRAQEIEDARRAWAWLSDRADVAGAAAMLGESAGAYVLSRLAATGDMPSAAVLQGALYRSSAGLIEFNGGRARAWYERGPDARAWLWAHARREYESAVLLEVMLAALEAGEHGTVTAADERGTFERSLAELAYDTEHPRSEQFAAITCPTLVLHGADDLNVPVEDAFATTAALWAAGNREVETVILSRVDHSMQRTPDDLDERLRQRMSFASFRNPFDARYIPTVAGFLRERLASA